MSHPRLSPSAGRLGVLMPGMGAVVAFAVSLLWSFPMQRRFVFRTVAEPAS